MSNPRDELVLDVRAWLDTWAPNCGAPRSVFEGQFKALIKQAAAAKICMDDFKEVVERACR